MSNYWKAEEPKNNSWYRDWAALISDANGNRIAVAWGGTREECSSRARLIVEGVNGRGELERCIAKLIGAYASFVRCHATIEPDMLPEIIEARSLLSRAGKEAK